MSSTKLKVVAQNILTYIVHARKYSHQKGGSGQSLYITLDYNTSHALDLREGDVLTIAIIKKERLGQVGKTSPPVK